MSRAITLLTIVSILTDSFPAVMSQQPPASPRKSAREVYESTLKGTAWVLLTQNGKIVRTGTGWVLSVPDRLLITNEHVVSGVDSVLVFFPVHEQGELVREKEYYLKEGKGIRGQVIDRDGNKDLALIQLETLPAGVAAIPLAKASAQEGDDVRTVGSSSAGSTSLWGNIQGQVRSAGKRPGKRGLEIRGLQTDMPINSGNSGGPLVNADGQLVGVNDSFQTDARNVSNHVELREVKAFLDIARPLANAKTANELMTRGKRRAAENRHRTAAADFTGVIKLTKGKDANAFLLRGQSNAWLGDYTASLADFDDALEVDPENYDARVQRADTYLQTDRLEKALADADAAIKIDRSRPEAYDIRGIVRLNDGRKTKDKDLLQKSVADFTRSIQLRERGNPYFLRSLSQVNLGRIDESVADAMKAVAIEPKSAKFQNHLGNHHFDRKEFEKAASCYAKAADLNTRNSLYYFNLADALNALGRYENTVKIMNLMIEAGVERPASDQLRGFMVRGLGYNKLKNHKAALQDFDRALAVPIPDKTHFKAEFATIYSEKSLSHRALGDTAAADAAMSETTKWRVPKPSVAPAVAAPQESLVGVWKHKKSYSINGKDVTFDMIYVFSADGSYSASTAINAPGEKGFGETIRGKYTLKNSQLKLTTDGGESFGMSVAIGKTEMTASAFLTKLIDAGIKEIVFHRD